MKAGQILKYMNQVRSNTLQASNILETDGQQGEQSQDCFQADERNDMHQPRLIQLVIPGLLREELETNDL